MTIDLNKVIGKNLNALRKERGLSQSQLADKIDISTEFISRVERGASAPSLKSLKKIADALEVKMGVFFDDPEDMDSWNIEIEALVILMKRGDKSIRKVYKLAEVIDAISLTKTEP